MPSKTGILKNKEYMLCTQHQEKIIRALFNAFIIQMTMTSTE